MTPREQRNERLAKTIIKNLQRRHIEGFYCATAEEAVRKVSELIEDGSSVTWGGTMTVRDLGIPDALKKRGTLDVLDRDLVVTPEEKQAMYLRAFSVDVYLSSANAISEDGVIVNIDGNGNRVAAITWGPSQMPFISSSSCASSLAVKPYLRRKAARSSSVMLLRSLLIMLTSPVMLILVFGI